MLAGLAQAPLTQLVLSAVPQKVATARYVLPEGGKRFNLFCFGARISSKMRKEQCPGMGGGS